MISPTCPGVSQSLHLFPLTPSEERPRQSMESVDQITTEPATGVSQILSHGFDIDGKVVAGTNDFRRFDTIAFIRAGGKVYSIGITPPLPSIKEGEIRVGSVRFNTLQLKGLGLCELLYVSNL